MLMRRFSWIAAMIASFFLAACSSKIESDVARFHNFNGQAQAGTFAIVPKDEAKIGSLEFEQYAALVRGQLSQLGFTPVNVANESDYIVEVDYDISDGQSVVRSRPTAYYGFYGHYGHHSLRHHAFYPHGFHGFGHYGFGHGFYGYPYYGGGVYSYTVYTRELAVDIVDADSLTAGRRELVFEGRAESVGRNGRLPEVMPYLVQAMFTNFPGESGVVKQVVIDLPDKKGRSY